MCLTSYLPLLLCALPFSVSFEFHSWLPPFNESRKIYELCNNEMDEAILLQNDNPEVSYYLEKYLLCYPDYVRFVPAKFHSLVWLMRALRFCEVNQLISYSRHGSQFNRTFQKAFLKYTYALICDKGRLLPSSEQFNLFIYSSLFRSIYQYDNGDRLLICNRISDVYADLYSRCYVPHVEKRQQKIKERCSGPTAPLLKFPTVFQRFSRPCDDFHSFINSTPQAVSSMGLALSQDVVFMNLLSSNLVMNIHSDSELPSLVLKTRLLLQHFSLAAVKLWKQIDSVRKCRKSVRSDATINITFSVNETEEDKADKLSAYVSLACCPHNNSHVCELHNEKRYRSLSEWSWIGFYIELVLLVVVAINTLLLAFLLFKTKRNLSTATVLFVFNIMFSNVLFLSSFVFFFQDLFEDISYGPVNEDHMEKSPELVIAETLQTHLFASDEFRKHLVNETLYSLAQNGSLIGLIHLLVLVLVVINRSMSGKSIHLSRLSVVSVFACVWFFLIVSHVMFSTMQISAIQNLDELFTTLAKGKHYLQCGINATFESTDIAAQCDRTAVFHAFGAYLLRGHTLFTVLFLTASIVIFTVTIIYHIRIRRQHDFIHSGLREQSPHRRRERLFHTLLLSIATFFLSVLGQTYIELAVFWVDEREHLASLTKWYHLARMAAFIDPVLNPLIVVARTPALRRQLRTDWTTFRSRTSDRSKSIRSSIKMRRSSSANEARKCAVEVRLTGDTDRPIIRSARRSQDSQTHNSVV